MITDIAQEVDLFVENSKLYLYPWMITIGILWAINILNWIIGSRLNILGIYPRHIFGLLGIIFSPIFHQNFNHLFFNTLPLFALGLVLLARGLQTFYYVTVVVVVVGGFGVWLFGRKAIHLGASGLVSGYFGFILGTAYLDPSFATLLLGAIVLYYFGSIFLGIFPQEAKISWESHLFGFLSGILSAFLPGIWNIWMK